MTITQAVVAMKMYFSIPRTEENRNNSRSRSSNTENKAVTRCSAPLMLIEYIFAATHNEDLNIIRKNRMDEAQLSKLDDYFKRVK